jgi:hypothetical protein
LTRLDPAIHVFVGQRQESRGCPGSSLVKPGHDENIESR